MRLLDNYSDVFLKIISPANLLRGCYVDITGVLKTDNIEKKTRCNAVMHDM